MPPLGTRWSRTRPDPFCFDSPPQIGSAEATVTSASVRVIGLHFRQFKGPQTFRLQLATHANTSSWYERYMSPISRREFLNGSAAGATAACFSAGSALQANPLSLPIGSQTYYQRQRVKSGD